MSSASGLPTGIVTFLFTDIEGSTRLWETNAAAMRDALASHDAILRGAIEAAGGVVFKTVGDAFCAAFQRPADALNAALDAQRRLVAHEWRDPIARLRVRMGIHTGSAVEIGGDYFGPTVNRVARFMSIGHGEQILVSGTTAPLLRDVLPQGVTLREAGTHRLKDLDRPEPAYQVVAPDLRADFPPLTSLDARPNNLPFQISSFVGRERELADVREMVAARRLVTIVGPGGIGKTRLALQAAGELIDRHADGVWLVQLSQVRTADLVPQATAEVLQVRESPQEPIAETIARALARSEALLVLDCAEHLVSGTAGFVKMLLSRCASLRILVTSREPLHLTGETVVRVAALDTAVQLFLDRAREVVPDLVVDGAALATVEEICERLEGIPLVIELAAARMATLSLAQLHARLSQQLSVLVSRDPTKEERHRTLRATVAWSYELLGADEAAVFRALGVFGGTFDVAAVAAVAERSEEDSLECIDGLVEKSLVSLAMGTDGARYVLSDAVYEFLAEVLTADGSLPDLSLRHFQHYEAFAGTMLGGTAARDVAAWVEAIGAEITNLRAALAWGSAQLPERAATLATALSRYWKMRGHISEGRTWFRRILANGSIPGPARAALIRRAATFATLQDDYDEARALSGECRALYEALADPGGVGEALHNLAVIEQRQGNLEDAAAQYAAALAKFREVGHRDGEFVALMNLALLAFGRDDLRGAERCIGEAEGAVAGTADPDQRATLSGFRGELALRRGDLDAAERFYRGALALKASIGNTYDVADAQNSLAVVYIRQNRVAEALDAARETMRIGLDLDAVSLIIYGFEAFSEIALYEGRHEDAARCFGRADELRRANSYRPTARKIADIERSLRAALRDRFDAVVTDRRDGDWKAFAARLAGTR
jgi:predicted ATPase/class 3 adenylate cyclase